MIVDIEPFSDELTRTIDAYLDRQYAETVAHTDIPPYDHAWETYRNLASMGCLLVVTARDDGELAGYVMYVVMPIPHHQKHRAALCDGIVTFMEHRGKGIARKMMAVAEPHLVQMGADRIIHHYRVCYDTEPVFPKLGYKLIEHVYMKEV